MCVQFFLGPTLAYNGLDPYQFINYRMKIPEDQYFGYAIPAVLLFIAGLHLNAGNNKGEIANRNKIADFVKNNPSLGYQFIGLGFVSGLIADFFSSELAFVFYLLAAFKFIGLFLLILGDKEIKTLPLIVVIGSIVLSSLSSGMFHDLMTWIIYTAAIFGLKYKYSRGLKLVGAAGFLIIASTIQILKGDFRKELNTKQEESGVETFSKVFKQKDDQEGVFNFENLASSNVRINQGFIITNIMITVPDKVEFANGEELYTILEAAFLPRIIAPNKLNAGDRTLFTKYSGLAIKEGTSMGLSSLGDAYINFGVFGGCVFIFVLGFVYSQVLNFFHKKSFDYPILILFVPLIFYYPIRPDCELQTILGHLVKGSFLVYGMIMIWNSTFKSYRPAV
jgi:hypothetical protein